jgi:hypothetical protein
MNMALPKINRDRLQQIVTGIEKQKVFRNEQDLAFKVVQTNWAQELDLDVGTIVKLFKNHNIEILSGKEPTPPPAPPPPPVPVVPVQTVAPPKVVKKESAPPAPPPAPVVKKEEPPTPSPQPKHRPAPVVKKDPVPPPAPVVKKEEPPVQPKAPEPEEDEEEDEEIVTVSEDEPNEEEPDAEEDRGKRYEEGGRGKKQCPACRLYVGARMHECPCGHQFQAGTTVVARRSYEGLKGMAQYYAREHAASNAASRYGARTVLFTPAGKAPIAIKKVTLEGVKEWAEEIRRMERTKRDFFVSIEALMMWLGTLDSIPADERKKAFGYLTEIYADEWPVVVE